MENKQQMKVINVSSEMALKRGRFLGEFFNMINEFGIVNKKDEVSKLHNMSRFYQKFRMSIEKTPEKKILKAKECIAIIAELQDEMHVIEELKEKKQIPVRVGCSDNKISEIVIENEKEVYKGMSNNIIMPDIIHNDFGETVRTTCCSVTEDEKDLRKVTFDIDLYKAYKKGFLSQTEKILTPLEIKTLNLSVKTMIFLMGLKYLTDYLNGNICHDVLYKNQNLDRAKNQFKLLESFTEQLEESSLGVVDKNVPMKHYKETTSSIKVALEEFLQETKTYHQTILFN